MTEAKRLTTLEIITDRGNTSTNAAKQHRDKSFALQNYREGEAAAYHDAHKIMKAELERLRNLWQNGGLSYDEFGLPS